MSNPKMSQVEKIAGSQALRVENQSAPCHPGLATTLASLYQRRWVRIFLAVATLTVLAIAGRRLFVDLDRMLTISLPSLLGLLFVQFFAVLLPGETIRVALRVLGHSLRFGEALYLAFVRAHAGLVVTLGGMGAAGLYLKLKHQVRFSDFATLLLAIQLIQTGIIGFLGLSFQIVFLGMNSALFSALLLGIFGLCAILGFGSFLFRLPLLKEGGGHFRIVLLRLQDTWLLIAKNPATLAELVALQVCLLGVRACSLYAVFWALEIEAPVAGVIIVSLLAALVAWISLTPSGLGFREAAIVYASQAMDVSPSEALAAALLGRLVATLLIVSMGQVGLWRLKRPLRSGSR